MSTATVRPEATVTITVDETTTPQLTVSEGEVTLDEKWSPYVQATVTVPVTDQQLIEQIDPKTDQRVVVHATEIVEGSTRTLDLALRGRTVDHKTKTIELTLASDEALLIDKRLLSDTPDKTPRDHEGSLRDIVSWALDKIGATLEAGTDDADLTAHWPLTNLVTNPSYEVNANDTALSQNAGSLSSQLLVSPPPAGGTRALRFTAVSAGTSTVYPAGWSTTAGSFTAIRVRPGQTYTASLYAAGSIARSCRIALRFRDEGGNALSSTYSDYAVDDATGGMERYHVTATAPSSASYASIVFESTDNTAGQFHYIDGVMLTEGDELVDYFDGAIVPAGYTTEWDGAAQLSASQRIPDVERTPELFAWKPGVALWDFLQPLFESAALRLFCDEQRVWRLVNPEAYETPGYVVVKERYNATEGNDTIDRNEPGLWADGVVCAYTWTDANGNQQEAYDFAGTDGKVQLVEYKNTPYPGPGAAAFVLRTLQGGGRVQAVIALTRYTATPGQDVTINLPGTLPQIGKVRTVTFDLGAGVMEIGTRGLLDAEVGSWAAWDPAQTWSEVDPGLTWDEA